MSLDLHNFDEDALDQLLRRARWQDPSPQAQQRLRRAWGELHGPSLNISAWSALAASVLLAAAVASWVWLGSDRDSRARRVMLMSNDPATALPVEVRVIPKPAELSRPATLAERLMVESTRPRPRATVPAPQDIPPPSTDELIKQLRVERASEKRQETMTALLRRGDRAGVEAVLSRLIDPDSRGEALAAVRAGARDAEAPLLAALSSPSVEHRFAAARALAEICPHGTAGDELRRMVNQNLHRREALAALMLCRDPDAATFLQAARADPSINAEIHALKSQLPNTF